MHEVSMKLAPILQVGESHEEAAADEDQPAGVAQPPVDKVDVSAQEELRDAIRGRKESVIVEGSRVL